MHQNCLIPCLAYTTWEGYFGTMYGQRGESEPAAYILIMIIIMPPTPSSVIDLFAQKSKTGDGSSHIASGKTKLGLLKRCIKARS